MWTENVAWFSNEVGQKGRIKEGELADVVVPDRDFYACPESDIADTTSLLTVVGGKVVFGAAEFAVHDDNAPPPAMPDWSPVRRFGGYAAWGDGEGKPLQAALMRQASAQCACKRRCAVHGHAHAAAATLDIPASDFRGFWGALGCACWAV